MPTLTPRTTEGAVILDNENGDQFLFLRWERDRTCGFLAILCHVDDDDDNEFGITVAELDKHYTEVRTSVIVVKS